MTPFPICVVYFYRSIHSYYKRRYSCGVKNYLSFCCVKEKLQLQLTQQTDIYCLAT